MTLELTPYLWGRNCHPQPIKEGVEVKGHVGDSQRHEVEILFELACVSWQPRTEPESKAQPDVADCGLQSWAARSLQEKRREERGVFINCSQQHSAPSIPQRTARSNTGHTVKHELQMAMDNALA